MLDEKILLHGTSWDNADSIVQNRFDNRICRRECVVHGFTLQVQVETFPSFFFSCIAERARDMIESTTRNSQKK